MINLIFKTFSFDAPIILNYLLAFSFSFCLVMFLMPRFIKIMNFYKIGEDVRDLKIDYSLKKRIPPMGGLVIVFSVIFSYLFFSTLKTKLSFVLPLFYILFAVIGAMDDYIKIKGKKSGLKALFKMLGQSIICLILFFTFIYKGSYKVIMPFNLNFPFINQNYIYLGAFLFFIFIFFVVSGTSNAVNLTDGLDGLASLSLLTNFVFIFVYVLTKNNSYNQDWIEIAIFSSSIIGATLGFIWYNGYPAQIFMGDIGSLSYGGILGILFVLIRQELALPLVGIVFFIETFSVILQRSYKLLTGKKLFKLTPVHHHYELNGIHENKIVLRSFIISLFSFIFSMFLLLL